jgi:hypothetical protein
VIFRFELLLADWFSFAFQPGAFVARVLSWSIVRSLCCCYISPKNFSLCPAVIVFTSPARLEFRPLPFSDVVLHGWSVHVPLVSSSRSMMVAFLLVRPLKISSQEGLLTSCHRRSDRLLPPGGLARELSRSCTAGTAVPSSRCGVDGLVVHRSSFQKIRLSLISLCHSFVIRSDCLMIDRLDLPANNCVRARADIVLRFPQVFLTVIDSSRSAAE